MLSNFYRSFFTLSVHVRKPPLTLTHCIRPCQLGVKLTSTLSGDQLFTNLRTNHLPLYKALDSSPTIKSALLEWTSHKDLLSSDENFEVLQIITYKAFKSGSIKKLTRNYNYRNLYKKIGQDLKSLNSNEVVKYLWLSARVRWSNNYPIHQIVIRLKSEKLDDLKDKELGLILWSLTILNHSSPQCDELIKKIVNETIKRLDKEAFTDQRALANICWSLASLNKWPAKLTTKIISFLKKNTHQFHPHSLSHILWSLQKSGIILDQWLLESAANIVNCYFKSSDSQTVAMLIWILGKSQYFNKDFYDKMSETILSGEAVHMYTPRLLAHLLWTAARVQYYNPELLDYIADCVLSQIDHINAHNIANIGYAYGFLNHSHHPLMEALAERIVKIVDPYWGPQALMNIAWSCLVMGLFPVSLFEVCLSEKMIAEVIKSDTMATFSSIQILQLDLATRFECPHLALPCLSPEDRGNFLMRACIGKAALQSTFHNVVAAAVKGVLGSDDLFIVEAQTTSGYAIDIEVLLNANNQALSIPVEMERVSLEELKELCLKKIVGNQEVNTGQTLKGEDNEMFFNLASDWEVGLVSSRIKRRMGIEVDGPIHFAVNSNHPLGRTVLKRRQLTALGWDMISIPYLTWQELGFNTTRQANYVRECIFK